MNDHIFSRKTKTLNITTRNRHLNILRNTEGGNVLTDA